MKTLHIGTARLGLILPTLATLLLADIPLATAGPPLWKQLMPRKRIEADANADYTLAEADGPWLVLAASFTGETGEAQARELVMEFRSRYNLPAYYYGMTFNLGGEDVGRGVDSYGGSIRRRVQRGNEVVQHAVLVGEFPTVDDMEAQELLEQVKTMQPKTLSVDTGETAQTLAGVRQFYDRAKQQMGRAAPAGPMSHAFMTRNPLLPREYFVPTAVAPEVLKWNRGLKYSLLNCPGRYTVRVATFRGRVALDGAKGAPELSARTRAAKLEDPLVEAAQKAHEMVVSLRKKGWDAYEMHDRHESYVTIGAFNDGQQLANGQIVLDDRNAKITLATFSAATPNSSLMRQPMVDVREEALRKQKFSQLMAGQGQTIDGFNPKSINGIPFDIIPKVVSVPRQSISATYARN